MSLTTYFCETEEDFIVIDESFTNNRYLTTHYDVSRWIQSDFCSSVNQSSGNGGIVTFGKLLLKNKRERTKRKTERTKLTYRLTKKYDLQPLKTLQENSEPSNDETVRALSASNEMEETSTEDSEAEVTSGDPEEHERSVRRRSSHTNSLTQDHFQVLQNFLIQHFWLLAMLMFLLVLLSSSCIVR